MKVICDSIGSVKECIDCSATKVHDRSSCGACEFNPESDCVDVKEAKIPNWVIARRHQDMITDPALKQLNAKLETIATTPVSKMVYDIVLDQIIVFHDRVTRKAMDDVEAEIAKHTMDNYPELMSEK